MSAITFLHRLAVIRGAEGYEPREIIDGPKPHQCSACDVRWVGAAECWCCGRNVNRKESACTR